MKFKLKLSSSIYILVSIIFAITLASFIINILILAQAGNFVNTSPIITSISLVCSVLMFALCLALIFNTCYFIRDTKLSIIYGIFPTNININNIKMILEDSIHKNISIQYLSNKAKSDDELEYLLINIKPELNADFIKILLSKNSQIKHNSVIIEKCNENDNTPDNLN